MENKKLTIEFNIPAEEMDFILSKMDELNEKLAGCLNDLRASNKILIGSSGDYTEQDKSEK